MYRLFSLIMDIRLKPIKSCSPDTWRKIDRQLHLTVSKYKIAELQDFQKDSEGKLENDRGIYILWGNDENKIPYIYVGKSDLSINGGKEARLLSHIDEGAKGKLIMVSGTSSLQPSDKRFLKNAYTVSDEMLDTPYSNLSLNSNLVQALEMHFINLAVYAGKSKVINDAATTMQTTQEVYEDYFIPYVEAILDYAPTELVQLLTPKTIAIATSKEIKSYCNDNTQVHLDSSIGRVICRNSYFRYPSGTLTKGTNFKLLTDLQLAGIIVLEHNYKFKHPIMRFTQDVDIDRKIKIRSDYYVNINDNQLAELITNENKGFNTIWRKIR